MDIRPQLREQLRQLRMPGMWHALETRLAEARQTDLGHLEFLSLLIQDELTNRENNMLATRIRNAGFGLEKTFTEFDFRFNESALSAALLRDLATCHFIGERRNVVIGGPPGIGKTHVAKAIGHEACRAGYQVLFRTTQKLLSEVLADSAERAQRVLRKAVAVDLLILDDFAFRKLDQQEAEMLYVLAEERLGRSSTVMTSNRPPDDWYATFPDPVVGGAILDRLVSSAIKILTTAGRSYRREVMGAVAPGTSGHAASKTP